MEVVLSGQRVIDLNKAYDSIPREAMWMALVKLGVPDETVQLIKSFHQDMKARIHIGGAMLKAIDTRMGSDKKAAWLQCCSTRLDVVTREMIVEGVRIIHHRVYVQQEVVTRQVHVRRS